MSFIRTILTTSNLLKNSCQESRSESVYSYIMDDCTLKKLTIKQGIKLAPAFRCNVTDYAATIGSDVDLVTLDILTNDAEASYSIWGADSSKTVAVSEGINDIRIEVTAEDGTIRNYFVHLKKLTANDASLSDLKVSNGLLEPRFNSDILEYFCSLPCHVSNVDIMATASNSKSEVKLGAATTGTTLQLNSGQTALGVEVTSPNKNIEQVYSICLVRKQIPRHIKFQDLNMAIQYECPISLSALYCPVVVKNSDPKHIFSGPFIDTLTKILKIDPLSSSPLPVNWRIQDYEMEEKMKSLMAYIPLSNGCNTEAVPYAELGCHLEGCQLQLKTVDLTNRFTNSKAELNHRVQLKNWEKHLHKIFDEFDVNALKKQADEELAKYFNSLPKGGNFQDTSQGHSCLKFLEQAMYCIATAIKYAHGEIAGLHLYLAKLLEEKYYITDMYGLKTETVIGSTDLNIDAKESSKEEECAAICSLHGVKHGSSLEQQLKALDQEYHQLLSNGQSGRADHLQILYAWKSKQATQEGIISKNATDEDYLLGQAALKYFDTLFLDGSKAMHHFHVGRMLVMQGSYQDAVQRLEVSLAANPKLNITRFYLGFALAMAKDSYCERVEEMIGYLQVGMESLLNQNTKLALTSPEEDIKRTNLLADNLLRSTNVDFLRAILQLGILIQANPSMAKDCMSAENIFHTAALLSAQALASLEHGDIRQQVEWVLLESHCLLLDLLSSLPNSKQRDVLITQRCQYLCTLLQHTSIQMNSELQALQRKTCERFVFMQPCNSHTLNLLGSTQLSIAESSLKPSSEENEALHNAKLSFQASIHLQGKPMTGEPPEELKEQKWWKIKVDEKEKEKESAAKKDIPVATSGRQYEGRSNSIGPGLKQLPNASASKHTIKKPVKQQVPQKRGKPIPTNKRQSPIKAKDKPGVVQVKDKSGVVQVKDKLGVIHIKDKPDIVPAKDKSDVDQIKDKAGVELPPAATASAVKSENGKTSEIEFPVKINITQYHPWLGLARIFHLTKEIQESQKCYEQVIELAPQMIDAYVELAEMLTKSNPLAAVDVYTRFPIPESPSYDDAYIFGEIVHLLIKHECYDDQRLGPNMITYGRILGIGCLENYVKILESKFKTDLLKTVYAGINKKDINDPEMQAFFKIKCWL